jgi:uncharacterized surface protein with fasciclin (FAS1) repeats
MRTSNVERRTSNVEVKKENPHLLRRSTFDVRRSTFAFIFVTIAAGLSACTPAPKSINNSQRINAGIDIVPEAVLASQKIPPSNQSSNDQSDLIDLLSDSTAKNHQMIDLLKAAGMEAKLRETGPFTILAPTDEAFNKLPPGVLDRLKSHHDQLVAFLNYHILPGRIEFADMLQTNGQIATIGGANVIVKGIGDKAMVNDANVIRSESSAANGVVHWVDNVLILSAGGTPP